MINLRSLMSKIKHSSTTGAPQFKFLQMAALALILCWPLPDRVHAAAGDLDLSFGSNGKVTTDFSGRNDSTDAVAIQSDGKIVVAGNAFIESEVSIEFALARYNTDGSLDPSFGSAGRVHTEIGNVAMIFDMVIQPDGKIVVTGLVANHAFGLARYNNDGSLDTSFGSGGKAITEFFGGPDLAQGVALQSDGKIVVAGFVFDLRVGNELIGLVRYNSDGTLDSTFGPGGKVTTKIRFADRANDVVVQPDGKIIAAGSSGDSSIGTNFALVRYNADGSLDPSFGSGGVALNHPSSMFSARGIRSIALQPDGRIVAAAFGEIARYNANGSLDSSFGSMGEVIDDFSFDKTLVLQPDGKIVVSGTGASEGTGEDFALQRYNSNGSLDLTFGSGGKVSTDFGDIFDVPNALAIQNDGKIVQVGSSFQLGTQMDFALVRYDSGIQLPTFNLCIQDDSNGSVFRINIGTGDYQFANCSGLTASGIGSITTRGGITTLQHIAGDRRVLARIDTSVNKGTATIQMLSVGTTFTITDRNTANNTCACR